MRKLGIDRAIGYSVILQLINLISKPGLLALMVVYLNKEEQGYQYTILGLIGLRALFEMGLGLAVISFAGKEAARVNFTTAQEMTGDERSVRRVASLFQLVVKAYIAIASVFGILVLSGGWYLLSNSPNSDTVNWQAAWVIAVLSTAMAFGVDGVCNFTIGVGQVANVIKIRFFSNFAQIVTYAVLLVCGAKLMAAPIANLISVFALGLLLYSCYRVPLKSLWQIDSAEDAFHWRRDILPFQWRVAVSWFSAYVLAQAIILMSFETLGAITAGQIGLSIALSATIYSLAFGWVAARQPRFGTLIGLGEFTELRRLFIFSLKRAIAVHVLGIIAMFAIIAVVGYWKPQFLQRILPWELMLLVMLAGLMNTFVDSLGVCLSSFQKEPLMPIRLAAAISMIVGTYVSGILAGVQAMITIMSIIAVVTAIVAWWIWRRKMAIWTLPA